MINIYSKEKYERKRKWDNQSKYFIEYNIFIYIFLYIFLYTIFLHTIIKKFYYEQLFILIHQF